MKNGKDNNNNGTLAKRHTEKYSTGEGEMRQYGGMKRIKVCYLCMYGNSRKKPTKYYL
jgi:hypothetical protein